MEPELNHIKAVYAGNQELISEEQYKLFKREKYSPFGDLIPLFVQLALLMGVVEAVKRGTPLTVIPIEAPGLTLLVPAAAAVSAFIMCFVQNKINVLQSEQWGPQPVWNNDLLGGTIPVPGALCIHWSGILLDMQQSSVHPAAGAAQCLDQSQGLY